MSISNQPNPRIAILRSDVERVILQPFRSHGWVAEIVQEHDYQSSLEVVASKGEKSVRLGVLYSTATENAFYKNLEQRVQHIFFNGQPYMLDSFAQGISVPVEPLGDFFPLLVALNKQMDPDRTPAVIPKPKIAVRRITDENPRDGILARLQQFTSVNLAAKLVERRASHEAIILSKEQVATKAAGIAYAMRNALDYISFSSTDRLNKRILGLYYGTIAFAFAEMLASPSGPSDLDDVEEMTKQGHGLYAVPGAHGGFADVHVGVLATGFLPQWLAFLGLDTSTFPKRKPRSASDLDAVPDGMSCTLQSLFASMPEIDDLFTQVFGGTPGWIVPVYDMTENRLAAINGTGKKVDSTYALFVDRSGSVPVGQLENSGWPITEVQQVERPDINGTAFRARVDHSGRDSWWDVLPTHSSPFGNRTTLLFPTIGGMREYRTIAATTLYALSILVRYMPSAWRRIEGGDEDQYLALVKASLGVWERVLPEEFLECIACETVVTAQPGSWLT
ncbi:YaaC family protein [Burkholderia ambifaria]|uniref:YaaC family protein n=1 Tax=Burkholderia ambifaria TaxID=152480 RepID=UPI00158A6203|nr:hypothetical protein [Burkholderia ambifaria]